MRLQKSVLIIFLMGLLVSVGFAASNGILSNLFSQSGISVEALKGPDTTDLFIHVTPDIIHVKKIRVKAYYTNGTSKFTRNFADAVPVDGIILIQFDDLLRGERVDVRVQMDKGSGFDESAFVILRPDLVLSSVEYSDEVIVGDALVVNVSVREINGDSGAQATVALMNKDTVFDTANVSIDANGIITTQLSTVLQSIGEYNLSAIIMNTVPVEYDETNNKYPSLIVRAVARDPEPVSFSSSYYYQNTTLNNSHFITTSGHEDWSIELLQKEDEVIQFTAFTNRSVEFPVDRLLINITNEAGEGNIYEEIGIFPSEGSGGTFTKYYPESNTLLTLSIDGSGTSVSIDSKANRTIKQSTGYLYWSYKDAQEWNVTTNSSSGKLIRTLESLNIRIEITDGPLFMGGNAVTGIVNRSYIGGWSDNTEGSFEEQRTVWIYSGKSYGDTTI